MKKDDLMCACNNGHCEGICREQHLVKVKKVKDDKGKDKEIRIPCGASFKKPPPKRKWRDRDDRDRDRDDRGRGYGY
jgi:hypothetical protein